MDKKLTDKPIETLDEDSLNIKNFTDALTDTIIETATPYSISLYGEWGSGKTSILNIVKKALENKGYNIVWINAWTTFTLAGQKELRNLFVAQILASLFPLIDNLVKLFKPFFVHTLVNLATKTLGADKKCTQAMLNQLAAVPLQERFRLAIEMANTLKGTDKTVIFVDDLDRIKPTEVLVLLDAISIFFKVKGCVFVLAMDHHRLNNAIEKINSLTVEQEYHSHYLDKAVQLNVVIPVAHYNIKKLLLNILDISQKSKNDERAINYYVSLTLYSVGSIPRNIKKICSKFNFYKKILLTNIQRHPTDTEKDFHPLGNSYLFQALFAMICLQESYRDLYEKIVSTDGHYKEVIHEIQNCLQGRQENIHIKHEYVTNIHLRKTILSFFNSFIPAIDVHQSENKSFSAGGRFLIATMAHILQHSENKYYNFYHEKLPFSIKNIQLIDNLFKRHLKDELESTTAQLTCTSSDSCITLKLSYPCGQASFSFIIIYKNRTIISHIESRAQNSQTWRPVIFNWLEKNCEGLPERKYIPHSEQFIQFDTIFYENHSESSLDQFKFFIKTSFQLTKSVALAIKKLHIKNISTVNTLLYYREYLLQNIRILFSEKEWQIEDDLDITHRWRRIMISKDSWIGKLYISLEPHKQYLQDIVIGIKRTIWNGKFKDNADIYFCNYATEKCGTTFESSSYYVIYRYTTPRSLSKSDYFSGLKLLSDPEEDPITSIIENLKQFKELENEIEKLARKARY